ncbi:MAG: sprT domain-containing protein [Pyrinomonadaceae bacterium]|nr:sprT domain-containing protein [Sphingobacteriaceae bacterium]
MDKIKILEKYVPPEAAFIVARWIDYFKCDFKVSRGRNTKFGDYRPPYNGDNHRISVNYNLNPYAFLVTTVHEFAHLQTWNEYKGKAKPHGLEWKLNFKKMMKPFFEKEIFPPDLLRAINVYLENPAASSCSDLNLFRALKKYDAGSHGVTVETLPLKAVFKLKDGRIFRKEELVRKRYKCMEMSTRRMYLFNPLAEVFPVEEV